MPSFRGKTGISLLEAKKAKEKKEGLGPSEVAPSGHLTWPLNPLKKNKEKQKTNT